MKVAIHTLGTRGDIQPYLALAIELKAAGHQVLIAAPSQYESMVGLRNIGFAHLPGEFLTLMETPEAKAAMAGGGGFSAGFKLMSKFRPIGRRQLSDEWHAAQRFDPDLIIYHPKAIGAPHIGEKLGIPTVLASPLPGFTPTAEFASPMSPLRSLGPLNRLSHGVMANGAEAIFRGMIAEWRVTELELPRKPRRPLKPAATLYAYSPHVLPRPKDWSSDVDVTGYWFLNDDREWQPDPPLAAFLSNGAPPVYVGFGSMPGLNPSDLTNTVTEALARAGQRGILAVGGGALRNDVQADHVFVIEGAPHDRLFPLVSACVHHGGAGTTGAAFRAGRPQLICPFFGDQPFWGRRIADLGVGPQPLPRKQLTAVALATALVAAAAAPARQRAEALGQQVRAEAGVRNAIAFLARRGLITEPAINRPAA